ncbi:hypothetical protein NUV26_08680 [Burkholderia pseudomultivorans]|uniref:hypothetical protein n=1 Tax=Burkholderia pseudomultivorans TaxID=1207504 RepID=UPI0012DA39E7|nr:hypothetical protein [Burkholderia pseudomultivorans]MDS0792226.1 hypothetical protein [Burkholderia pseudomultivorans]
MRLSGRWFAGYTAITFENWQATLVRTRGSGMLQHRNRFAYWGQDDVRRANQLNCAFAKPFFEMKFVRRPIAQMPWALDEITKIPQPSVCGKTA